MDEPDAAHARRQAIIDRLLSDALRPAGGVVLPSHDALPADIRMTVDRLLAKADSERRRSLTYDDLEEALPPRDVTADDLEAIFWVLAEYGIELDEGE
ncbi:RNA polymerase sigma factor region1.1 domain-containing protein [Methylobacterium sp. Leaf118]|uniref:RNA polymerase sigma factor region1.1 domain-containing protein n=1 Tax=Methylobacterium sp. Leaf118 TaxID=2876562 RepID=UPI001E451D96|nr:RNA polymerase sigma factor region1.1 domain-containing protein [Methylobacterium sp. Leaf118]